MAKSVSQKKTKSGFEQRTLRRNQIVFSVLSVIVILSWIVALLAK